MDNKLVFNPSENVSDEDMVNLINLMFGTQFKEDEYEEADKILMDSQLGMELHDLHDVVEVLLPLVQRSDDKVGFGRNGKFVISDDAPAIFRFKLEDKGQDLLWIDVEFSSDTKIDTDDENCIGIIIDTNPAFSVPQIYKGKPIKMVDNQVGTKFEYADPSDGFTVTELKYNIVKVEWWSHAR